MTHAHILATVFASDALAGNTLSGPETPCDCGCRLPYAMAAGSAINIGTAFYAIIALAFSAVFVRAYSAQPLLPVQPENAKWSSTWLVTAVLDYYTLSACLCGVIVSTEREWLHGLLWCLSFLLLGAPFACAWVVSHVWFGDGTLEVAPVGNGFKCGAQVTTIVYSSLGVLFLARLVWTVYNYPLFPLLPEDALWSYEWLLTTCGDYYTAAACFVGVTLSTEQPLAGVVWTLAQLVFGGPASCCYAVWCLQRYGTLCLSTRASAFHYADVVGGRRCR